MKIIAIPMLVLSSFALTCTQILAQQANTPVTAEVFETTFSSKKAYADPFNDVDVDVIFTQVGSGKTWRVPTFWRGKSQWTVRFRPPLPGAFTYQLESTDTQNADLNGKSRQIKIRAYAGDNKLLKRGTFKVSQNGRYFEQADGTPFYWLGDSAYAGFSDRMPWNGFQKVMADRRAKGYTVIQLAVMACSNEEYPPADPGFCNEGGCIWDAAFERLNPKYFHYADRRFQELIDAEMAPALIGAWRQDLPKMGIEKTKKLWRYIIARYGAYPVFWIAGGEIYDPPENHGREQEGTPVFKLLQSVKTPGWTDVVRYIRQIDPYGHPLSVHELPPPGDIALTDESLTDFDVIQPSHFGWASIADMIAQLNVRHTRVNVTKPLIVGEIGWELLGGAHFQDYQRTAFWLAMLNGAAGFSYGHTTTGSSYSVDKPFQEYKFSFLTWEEGMHAPSSSQVALGAGILQRYPWAQLAPHPEWITPRGTTLFEEPEKDGRFDIDLLSGMSGIPEEELPLGEWKRRNGDFRLPYASGIPGTVRMIYIPSTGFPGSRPPTVLNLEPGVLYRAYYWEPSLGIKFDLGKVQAEPAGERILHDDFGSGASSWERVAGTSELRAERYVMQGASLSILKNLKEADVVAAVDARSGTDAALVLRYQDPANYIAAVFSAEKSSMYFLVRKNGQDGEPIGLTRLTDVGDKIRLTAEVRSNTGIVLLIDGRKSFSSPIVDLVTEASAKPESGYVGLLHKGEGQAQSFDRFEVRRPGTIISDERLQRELYDASGKYRGTLDIKHWRNYGRSKTILLNAYRPDKLPAPQDWVLVLEAEPQA